MYVVFHAVFWCTQAEKNLVRLHQYHEAQLVRRSLDKLRPKEQKAFERECERVRQLQFTLLEARQEKER